MSFKKSIQKCSVTCTNTHHDATDLVNHEMVKKKQKLQDLKDGTPYFQKIKKFLACASYNTF